MYFGEERKGMGQDAHQVQAAVNHCEDRQDTLTLTEIEQRLTPVFLDVKDLCQYENAGLLPPVDSAFNIFTDVALLELGNDESDVLYDMYGRVTLLNFYERKLRPGFVKENFQKIFEKTMSVLEHEVAVIYGKEVLDCLLKYEDVLRDVLYEWCSNEFNLDYPHKYIFEEGVLAKKQRELKENQN